MTNIYENYLNLEEYLKDSADKVCNFSIKNCKHGIMAKDCDCTWYHSVWQYLRLLGLVSTPSWHDQFFKKELCNAINNKKSVNVLISGTADYSMLAYVIYACKVANIDYNIDVLDTCPTPLYACEWYSQINNFKINKIQENILKYSPNKKYDLICTDAFLTRFDKNTAQEVVNKWSKLLNQNGKIITTIRIHTKDENIKGYEENLQEEFSNKAKERTKVFQKYIQYSPGQIKQMAYKYITNMKSSNLGDENDILNFFSNLNTSYNISTVQGELKETKYIELVASLK